MYEKKRIYVVAKTYPAISEKYAELVCTAGILENGSWIRLFPMPFRLLDAEQKYPKYTWINVEVERHTADFRPESYRPNIDTLVVEAKPPEADWDERRKIIFDKQKIYTNLKELLDKKNLDNTSLAVFKPAKILDFIVEPDKRGWDTKKLASLQGLSQQLNLFQTAEEIEAEFRIVPKVPFKFSYKFQDDAGKTSTLMIEDWEIGMLYFNCLKRAGGDEKVATAKVREKYFDEFMKKDIHYFLGTTFKYHNVSPNPFIIVGVFYPPMPLPHHQTTLFDVSTWPKHNLPDRNPHFTGRDDILEEIHRRFQAGQAVSLRQTVAGLGGVGKTQTALEYAYRHAGDYDDIWWVDAESGLQEAYRNFARSKGLLPVGVNVEWADVLGSVRNWFNQHVRFLFIYDNVEDYEVLENCLPRANGHVLITTRQEHNPLGTAMDVSVFTEKEAADFLKERLGRDESDDSKELAARLGYLPLALEQAAAYMVASSETCRGYLELLKEHGLKMFEQRGAKVFGYKATVNTTWQIALEKIAQENKSAKQLLNICAYCAPDDIPLSLFIEGRDELPKPLRAALVDMLRLKAAVYELTSYSMLREKDGLLSIHRLVQEVVRDGLAGDTQWIAYCLNMAYNIFKYKWGDKQSMDAFAQNVPHVLAIAGYAGSLLENGEEAQKKTAGLYHVAGDGLDYNVQHKDALECYNNALAIREKVLGKEHPYTSTTYNNIANVYKNQGEYEKALEWYNKALAIREKALGREHPDTAATYNNIGEVYREQGDYGKALEWSNKALAIKEKVLGKEHPDTTATYNNIANVYYSQGDYGKALEWHNKALAIREKVLGLEHPDTASTYNNIAVIYNRQGDYAKALECCQKALAIREKILGTQHPDTATTYKDIATVYSSLSNYDKALHWCEKAVTIFENTLGTEHPYSLLTYKIISEIYIAMGDTKKAAEFDEKVHKETAKTLNEARIIILGEKGSGKTSLALRLKALTHPMLREDSSTEGLEGIDWCISANPEQRDSALNVQIWGFAGHVVTHAVHRCFMSERCLYILLLNGRTEGDNRTEYWLEQIRNYGGNSPVLVLVNKFDEHPIDLPKDILKREFPAIVDFYQIDISAGGQALEAFRQTVMALLRDNQLWKTPKMSATAYKVKEALRQRFNQGSDFIERKDFDQLAEEFGIKAAESKQLLDDLHDLGICLWYDYDDMRELGAMVLNPSWISYGIYRLINWGLKEKKQILTGDDFKSAFTGKDASRYPEDKAAFLFTLMKKYQLAFFKDTQKIFVPLLLPADRTDDAFLPDFPFGERLRMEYRANQALPPYTVARLAVLHSAELNEKLSWRFGALFRWKGTTALVEESEHARTVTVSVTGPRRTEYIDRLRKTLNAIFDDYKSMRPELMYEVIHTNALPSYESAPMLTEQAIIAYIKASQEFVDPYTSIIVDLWPTIEAYNLIMPAKSYGEILESFYQELQNQKYENAFLLLPELRDTDKRRYNDLMDELQFLFCSEESLEYNRRNWDKFDIKPKVRLWCLLKNGSVQPIYEPASDASEASAESAEEVTYATVIAEDAEQANTVQIVKEAENSQQIGEKLEKDMVLLLKELFTIDSSVQEEIEESLRKQVKYTHQYKLNSLGQQIKGSQLGFDIGFEYVDSFGTNCYCQIECKAGNQTITAATAFGKLSQALIPEQTVHQWIIISPNGKKAIDLDPTIKKWEETNRWWPIQKVQLWMQDEAPENNVAEFFGLIPEIYNAYYPKGKLFPEKWNKEYRMEVAERWKNKLIPGIRFKSWRDYLYNHRCMLTSTEQSPLPTTYDDLYNQNYAPIQCLDDSDRLQDRSAEELIIDWVKSDQSLLFLLGEFGEGKTFLTYSVTRKLAEEFRQSPQTGTLPIRFTLKDLKAGLDARDFLTKRLEDFNSHISEWNRMREIYEDRILVILDGFDEMSADMDSFTISENVYRLCECINEYFKGLKIIVTSRTPIFKTIKEDFLDQIETKESGKSLYLAPIHIDEKISYLSSFVETEEKNGNNAIKERFDKLCTTHDLLGLADKALFLDMMKATLLGEEKIEELDSLTIYENYVKETVDRKKIEQRKETIKHRDVLKKLERLMEDFALISIKLSTKDKKASLKDLKIYEDDSLAALLWTNLTSPNHEEDAENRIINRSLLKAADGGFEFCHRSMQEYFAARSICRLLDEAPSEAEDFLCNFDLTIETFGFAGQILSKSDNPQKAKSGLISIIGKTRGKKDLEKSSPEEYAKIARLGASAINLYVNAFKEPPACDLSNLVLDGAYLPEANFAGKELPYTSLMNAKLDNADFTKAILTGCDFTNVNFEKTKNIYDMQYSADVREGRSYLYALYSDGKLRKWALNSNIPIEVESFKLKAACYLGITTYGFMFFQKDHISFIREHEEKLEINGGVHLSKSSAVKILDILDTNVLFVRDDKWLSFYNMQDKENPFIFENYEITEESQANIIENSNVIVFNDALGPRILSATEAGVIETSFAADLEKNSIKKIAAMAVLPNLANRSLFRICIGYEGSKSDKIALYELDSSAGMLTEISSYTCKQQVKQICFVDNSSQIAYTGQDGVIYVLKLEENVFIPHTEWKLAIKCSGASIEGVKQREQYELLKSYIESAEKTK